MGAILGIVVAIVAIVLPLLALAFAFYCRKKSYLEVDFQRKFVVRNCYLWLRTLDTRV